MDSSVSGPRRSWWGIVRRVTTLVGLVAIFGYLALSLMIAHVLTRSSNLPLPFNPQKISLDAVAWSTRTADGLTLRGWYCPTPEHRRLIVLVHGMGGSLEEMAGIGRDLHGAGYDILLFDLRGHGSSDPSRLFMGDRERGDLLAVLKWASVQGFPSDRIGWVGHSMGASTLLLEGEKNQSIGAVVLDSAYGNLPELLDRQLTEHSHLPRLFNPGILLAARYVYGVRTDHLIPIRSAEHWNRPILLIHGDDDSVVPVDQAHQLAEALGSSCQAEYRPHVNHVGAYNAAPDWYISTVNAFFQKNLAP